MTAALEEALAHHQAGRHDQAETLYAGILAAEPAEPTALYLSGLLNVAMGRIGEAAERLSVLVEVRPRHVASRLALANLHALRGETTAATDCFRRVLALVPDHEGAQLGLAEALLATGQPAAALPPARRASRSGDSRALLALSRALLGIDSPAEALAAAEVMDAASCDGWLQRGACLKALCRPEEARLALHHAVAADPARGAARLNLGTICAELGLFDEAEEALRRALACDPACAEAHASLGSVLLLSGRIDAAEAAFRAALSLDVDLIVAHQNLAAILTARRGHQDARHHRNRAYRRQNLFVELAPGPAPRVLLLATGGGGNVPARFLLPRRRATRLTWMVDHARPDQPASLPPYDLVFNTIGDPDMAAAAETTLAAFLAVCQRPVLNAPAQVAATSRDRLPGLLAGIDDVVVPTVRRLPAGSVLADCGLDLPVLLRPAGSHGGQETLLIRRAGQLAGLRIAGPEPCYATEFQDFRAADGRYRKYRVIFVDRLPYFYHLAIADQWLVHYETAGMAADPAKRREEDAFLADPAAVLGARAMAAIAAIGRRLELDFAGADFSLLPDGRVLLFEANPTMLVHPEEPDGPFAHKNRHVETILQAFDRMVTDRIRPIA